MTHTYSAYVALHSDYLRAVIEFWLGYISMYAMPVITASG